MSGTLNALLNSLNAQIEALNKNNHKIYDTDNPEYYISKIIYLPEYDKFYFETQEDQ